MCIQGRVRTIRNYIAGATRKYLNPPDCAELLARVGVPLVPIGVWR